MFLRNFKFSIEYILMGKPWRNAGLLLFLLLLLLLLLFVYLHSTLKYLK